ncbi:MAG: TauD/TfdA family dioxygenase [Alphaproteobacteria bacterium]|nr:TauD/TfdA family dioxygenase [Alphaproteobacteria bacterium]
MSFEMEGPLPGATFGGRVRLAHGGGAEAVVAAAEADPAALPQALAAAQGLLLLTGMQAIAEAPELLLRLSRRFGPEVEDYRRTLTPVNQIHASVPEILVVSNTPPVDRQPPKLPDPPLTEDGRLPTRFPHRRGWHTDQSYRRPPPDISLFLGVIPVPKGQGQTLFADGAAAYDALAPTAKARIEGLEGLHAKARTGRSHDQVLAGDPVQPLAPHERSQRQPVVRVHPVTGRRALYLCEFGQMDWLEGPLVGMEPGPHGDGARLLFELMSHLTRPEFVYVHEWDGGDLLIWDNRCLMHAATWYDAAKEKRLMWRTTVSGNPGAIYARERKSWIPERAGELAAAEDGS